MAREEKNYCTLNKRWKLWMQSKVCGICGKDIPNYEDASVDHIVPRSRGGSEKRSNLQITHKWCNNHKDDFLPWQYRIVRFMDKYLFKFRHGKPNNHKTYWDED